MAKVITDEGIFEIPEEDTEDVIREQDMKVKKELNEMEATVRHGSAINAFEKEKREYISKHIIPHLRAFGNVYVPYKKVRRYGGEEKLLSQLREKGYDCDIAVFDGASIIPDGRKGKNELDAVLTLRR